MLSDVWVHPAWWALKLEGKYVTSKMCHGTFNGIRILNVRRAKIAPMRTKKLSRASGVWSKVKCPTNPWDGQSQACTHACMWPYEPAWVIRLAIKHFLRRKCEMTAPALVWRPEPAYIPNTYCATLDSIFRDGWGICCCAWLPNSTRYGRSGAARGRTTCSASAACARCALCHAMGLHQWGNAPVLSTGSMKQATRGADECCACV